MRRGRRAPRCGGMRQRVVACGMRVSQRDDVAAEQLSMVVRGEVGGPQATQREKAESHSSGGAAAGPACYGWCVRAGI